jgi:hypothetical protein
MTDRQGLRAIRLFMILGFAISFLLLFHAGHVRAADKEKKPPVTRYWVSIATEKTSIPGMPEGLPVIGALFGGTGGSGRHLLLQLNSPRTVPSEPVATHDIPQGQNMGDTLPLLIPSAVSGRERPVPVTPDKMEKPKLRMLIYWGCSEKIGAGQPRVLDTAKMNMAEFAKAMAGHTASPQYPPSPRPGWVYAEWPNRDNSTQVPKDSSLAGEHFVHGNYLPDIRFTMDEKHDFMAPVEFTSVKGGFGDSIRFQWRAIPSATGYFATAVGHNRETGEMIMWTSSETPEMGYGLMDYLPNEDVRRFIKEKVVMSPATTSCAIPQGIFKDAGGAALQFIAYGDELNIVYPPKDPAKPKDPIWTVKARLKSTGMLPLTGVETQGDQPVSEKGESPKDKGDEGGINTLKKLKGLLGL